jgi:hypothetical protein
MNKVMELAKNNLKVVITVAVLGLTVTLGWAKGCTIDLGAEPPTVDAPVK